MIPQNGSVSSLPFAFQSMLIRPFLPADAEPALALFRHTVKTVNRRNYSEEEVAAWLREEDVTPDMWLDSFTGKEKASGPHFSHKRKPLLSAPFPRLPSTPLLPRGPFSSKAAIPSSRPIG